MTIKEAILAAIKAKFPAINLSKKRLEQIATVIEKKVIDDETKIDAALTVYDEYNPLSEMAKTDDLNRGLAAKVKGLETPTKKDEKTEPAASAAGSAAAADTLDDGTPTWAKTLIQTTQTMAQRLATLEGEKVQSTIMTKAKEALPGIPASYWAKRTLPVKEEDLEAFVTEVQTDYTALTQELTSNGVKLMNQPAAGSGGAAVAAAAGTKTTAVSPEVKAFAEKERAARDAQANRNKPVS